MIELNLPEENHFRIPGRGDVWVILNNKENGRVFKVEDEVMINGEVLIITGIEMRRAGPGWEIQDGVGLLVSKLK